MQAGIRSGSQEDHAEKSMKRRPFFLTAICIISSFVGCSEESKEEKTTATETVDPSGGTITVTGGSIDVPPGALYGPQEMSVARTEETASLSSGVEQVSDIYKFGPSEVPLNSPVTITLSYDAEQVGDGDDLGIWWAPSMDGPWEYLGGSVDSATQTVRVEVRSLGFGVVGRTGVRDGEGGTGGEAGQSGSGAAGQSGSGGAGQSGSGAAGQSGSGGAGQGGTGGTAGTGGTGAQGGTGGTAGTGGTGGTGGTSLCETNAQCGDDYCWGGRCIPTCPNEMNACGLDGFCVEGFCWPACEADTDCEYQGWCCAVGACVPPDWCASD